MPEPVVRIECCDRFHRRADRGLESLAGTHLRPCANANPIASTAGWRGPRRVRRRPYGALRWGYQCTIRPVGLHAATVWCARLTNRCGLVMQRQPPASTRVCATITKSASAPQCGPEALNSINDCEPGRVLGREPGVQIVQVATDRQVCSCPPRRVEHRPCMPSCISRELPAGR